MSLADALERSRQRTAVTLAVVLFVSNLVGQVAIIGHFHQIEMRAMYFGVVGGAALSYTLGFFLARRGLVALAAVFMATPATLLPLVSSVFIPPPNFVYLTACFTLIGLLISSALGMRLLTIALIVLTLIGVNLLPLFRPSIEVSYVPSLLIGMAGALIVTSAKLRDMNVRALVETQTRLGRSEAGFRAIAETAPVPILLVGLRDRKVRFANKHFAKEHGAPSDGADVHSVFKVSENFIAILDTVDDVGLVSERVFSPEPDVFLSVWSRVIRHEDQEVAICAFHDVSTHKRAEEILERARDSAQAATRERTNFLANVSHELRTPLNGVLGVLQHLSRSQLEPDRRTLVERASRSATSLLRMVNDVLDFAKIEAGRLDLEHTEFFTEDLVFDAISLVIDNAKAKGLEVVAIPELHEGALPPERARGDPMRLGQVLLNLVANAVKFTERGHIEVRYGVTERDESIAVLRFQVKDTGIGISEAARKRVFGAFEQADTSMTRAHGGTGLGLAISSELASLMGGELSVESSLGEGSTFTFTAVVEAVSTSAERQVRARVALHLAENRERDAIALALERAGATLIDDVHAADVVVTDDAKNAPDGAELIVIGSSAMPDLARPVRPSLLIARLRRQLQLSGDHPLIKKAARGTLLLAEDDETNQLVARLMLENLGYDVEVVADGDACVETVVASPQRFLAILMDCQMPKLDGYDAARQIRDAGVELPIIAITAHAADHERVKAAGMDSYLQKPLRRERIEHELQSVTLRA